MRAYGTGKEVSALILRAFDSCRSASIQPIKYCTTALGRQVCLLGTREHLCNPLMAQADLRRDLPLR
jgi:hypothetical protein